MAHHPPDSAVALFCVLLSLFKWVWQWQPVHHKLSIDVALRKFCCQALCSSVSVTGYCVVICVPIFLVCASAVNYAFYVCWSCVYQCFWVIIKYLCASSVERKKNVAPILITQQKKNNNLSRVMSARLNSWKQIVNFALSSSHLCRLLHCFAPVNF